MQMTNEETRLDFIEKHAPRALYHYAHAIKKHPYFCDRLQPSGRINKIIKATLSVIRKQIRQSIADGDLEFDELLNCEVWEMQEALAKGDKSHAVEECYDAIAVLLRTIDVLEGRQKLGNPETKGETK